MTKMDSQTLEQLENDYWGEPPDNSSSLVRMCYSIRKKKLSDYEAEDLRVMINQNIGLDHLIPLSIAILNKNPFIEASYYEGDLLKSTLSVESKFWQNHRDLKNDLLMITRENFNEIDKLDGPNEIKEELKELFRDFLGS